MCHFTSRALKDLSLFLWCQNAENVGPEGDKKGVFVSLRERQSIAQKGVRAIAARNSQLENGSNATNWEALNVHFANVHFSF